MKYSKSYWWKILLSISVIVVAVVAVYLLLLPINTKVDKRLQGFYCKEGTEEYIECTLVLEGTHHNYLFEKLVSKVDFYTGLMEILAPEVILGSSLTTAGYIDDSLDDYRLASWMYYHADDNGFRNGYLYMDDNYDVVCISEEGAEYYFPAKSVEEARALKEKLVIYQRPMQ